MTSTGFVGSNSSFSEQIERLVKDKGIEYIDAIQHWCEKANVEIEQVGTLIKKDATLRAKIEAEAWSKNMLKKSARGAKLPI